MNWFKGWPITYLGISSLSAGSWINGGADAGLITCGFCLIISGLIQLVKTSQGLISSKREWTRISHSVHARNN